jgi:hypothetical protein
MPGSVAGGCRRLACATDADVTVGVIAGVR